MSLSIHLTTASSSLLSVISFACSFTSSKALLTATLQSATFIIGISLRLSPNTTILSVPIFLASSLMNRSLGKIIISNKAFDDEEKRRLCRYESEEEKKYFTASYKLHNKAYNFNDTGINILFKDGSVKEICEASDQLDRSFLSKEICKYFYYQI